MADGVEPLIFDELAEFDGSADDVGKNAELPWGASGDHEGETGVDGHGPKRVARMVGDEVGQWCSKSSRSQADANGENEGGAEGKSVAGRG